jgi:hypothetical protein
MPLVKDATCAYWFLTNLEFEIGIIGIADYVERQEVFRWLVADAGTAALRDPRSAPGHDQEERPLPEAPDRGPRDWEVGAVVEGANQNACNEDQFIQFIPRVLQHRWCFTKNDDDSYPSVPHGHFHDKTNAWPKLNPYTGRAFSAKNVENDALRLQKKEMINLWNDRGFRIHALETIAWYKESHPYYEFPVRNPFRLPRWSMR